MLKPECKGHRKTQKVSKKKKKATRSNNKFSPVILVQKDNLEFIPTKLAIKYEKRIKNKENFRQRLKKRG